MVKITMKVSGVARVGNPPVSAAKQMVSDYTFKNPLVDNLNRLGKSTFNVPRYIALANDRGVLTFPRTGIRKFVDMCARIGFSVDVEMQTFPRTADGMGAVSPEVADRLYLDVLDEYQRTAVDAMSKHSDAVLMAPTGSGKTLMTAALIARKSVPSMVLVHTTGLLQQTVEELSRWIGQDVGSIGAGRRNEAGVMVGMVQTLVRLDPGDPLFGRFGLVLHDETHTCPCATSLEVVNRFNAMYRYGVTATPKRKDGNEKLLYAAIGPIVHRIPVEAVVRSGRIVWPEVVPIPTAFSFDMSAPDQWTEMMTAIADDKPRLGLVASAVRELAPQDEQSLVLVERISHAQALAKELADMCPQEIHGGVSAKERRLAMDAVNGGARLAVGTLSTLGVGINVKGWSTVFLASPINGGAKTLQALGRVTRAKPGKTAATLYDFVDDRVPALKRAFKNRSRLYGSREQELATETDLLHIL